MLAGFAAVAILLIPLTVALTAWLRQRRSHKQIHAHNCPLCDMSFQDVLPTYMGTISNSEFHRLDKFQRRFAGGRFRCEACGGIVLCSKDGYPMRGYYLEADTDPDRSATYRY